MFVIIIWGGNEKIIMIIIILILTSHLVYGANTAYINNKALVEHWRVQYPFYVEIKKGQCSYANSVDELINWFNSSNTVLRHFYGDKFYFSDTLDSSKSYVEPLRMFSENDDSLNCVVGRIIGKFAVKETTTVTFGIDSDDAGAILLDGKPILQWLGPHSSHKESTGVAGPEYSVTITLQPGVHTLVGYAQDKDGYYVLVLFIKKDGQWKILDSSDFDFIPLAGYGNETFPQNNELYVNTSATDKPVMMIYSTDGPHSVPDNAEGMGSNLINYNFDNGKTIYDSIMDMKEGVQVPSMDYYQGVLVTVVYVEKPGTYEFGIAGDDATDFWIDGKPIVGYYGLHGSSSSPQKATTVYLTQGFHLFEVHYYENTGGSEGKLFVKVNGQWQIFSTSTPGFKLYRPVITSYTQFFRNIEAVFSIIYINNPYLKFKQLHFEVR